MTVRPRFLRVPFSLLYKFLYKCVEWTCGISLNYPVKVGRRVRIWHHSGMILGARCIGNDVHIRQNTTFGVARRGDSKLLKPIIEDRVDIGAGVVIAGAITIGHDSVIGANAVVLKDVPPYSLRRRHPRQGHQIARSEREAGSGVVAPHDAPHRHRRHRPQ